MIISATSTLRTPTLRQLRRQRPRRRWRRLWRRRRRSDRGKWCTPCACEAGGAWCAWLAKIQVENHQRSIVVFPGDVFKPWNYDEIGKLTMTRIWIGKKDGKSNVHGIVVCLFFSWIFGTLLMIVDMKLWSDTWNQSWGKSISIQQWYGWCWWLSYKTPQTWG